MIGVIAVTQNGRAAANNLIDSLNTQRGCRAKLLSGPAKTAIQEGWTTCDALICFLAVGATVRLVAPLCTDKRYDPPVLCVNETAEWVIPILGGHNHTGAGAGNDLAKTVAELLGATAVVTTASDSHGLGNIDHLFVDPDHDYRPAMMRARIDGATLQVWAEHPHYLNLIDGIGPYSVVDRIEDLTDPALLITSRTDIPIPEGATVIRPQHLVVGVGTSKGCPPDELAQAAQAVLNNANRHPRSVRAIASVTAKADEPAVRALADTFGVPVLIFPPEVLASIPVPNPSAHPLAAVGTPSVAEASALAATHGDLLVEKTVSIPTTQGAAMATAAVATDPVNTRGHLLLLGMGPGDPNLVPPATREALAQADVVIGLDQYLDRCRQWISPNADIRPSGLGNETGRAKDAVATARNGHIVALISGGDIGTFAMASPALEALGDADDIDVTVVPGITASLTAAALLGAPLGHDHCNISLSNLMTPWAVIQQRVQAAAMGDFVICLYNPRSKDRNWQLDWVKETLLAHRSSSTPVGLVTDASRPTQNIVRTTLGELDTSLVDMLTMVVIGSSQTEWMGPRMVTPRGYSDKYADFAQGGTNAE
ncbi:precorrin-3B C(17)-methyltransferase [Stomatohabitans albus]|uniref:precorrin-3B C(17)-methyltransferase n=1 Tax=Stomatohabitans albus TaxID=3110766 RepID=UPI00300C7601